MSECLDQSGFSKLKYHAIGLQTVLKLIENDLNNQPLGYSYGRDSDNSSILRLIQIMQIIVNMTLFIFKKLNQNGILSGLLGM